MSRIAFVVTLLLSDIVRGGGTRKWVELIGWLALTYAAAGIGAVATTSAPDFYLGLDRPGWAPPAGLFGPVWTLLYTLIGIAAWQVWRERNRKDVKTALILFGVQLAANALWTWIFFRWQQGALAFAEILVLILLIVATTVTFWRVRRSAGLLFLPYLAWVCYAAALTLSTWQRNSKILG